MLKQDPTVCAVKWNEVERTLSTSIESGETYDENETKLYMSGDDLNAWKKGGMLNKFK